MVFDVRLGRNELKAIQDLAKALDRLAAAHEKIAAADDPDVQAALDAASERLRKANDKLEGKVEGTPSPSAP